MAPGIDEEQLAQEPAALAVEQHVEQDEQEDWEYEYSTTETEARGFSDVPGVLIADLISDVLFDRRAILPRVQRPTTTSCAS